MTELNYINGIEDRKGNMILGAFTDFLIKEYNLIVIHDVIYMWNPDDKCYVEATDDEFGLEARALEYFPNMKDSSGREIMYQVKKKKRQMPTFAEGQFSNMILYRNGIYNLDTKTLIPSTPEYPLLNRIDWDYEKDAYSAMVEKVLMNVCDGDKDKFEALCQMIGHCMLSHLDFGKAFILIGDGSNGKSIIQAMLRTLLGKKNTVSLDMNRLCEDKFAASQLYGKLANIPDDMSDACISDPSAFKSLCTGETLNIQRKFENGFDFLPYASMVFSVNNMPVVKHADYGVRRRLQFITFDHEFKETDPDFDPHIKKKIIQGCAECSVDTNMSYLINLGLHGIETLEKQGFIVPKSSAAKLAEYDEDCNPMLTWANDYLLDVPGQTFEGSIVGDAYADYKADAVKKGLKPSSQKTFSAFIKQRYKLVSKVRYFPSTATSSAGNKRVFVDERE